MNKKGRILAGLLLCICLLASAALVIHAEEGQNPTETRLTISTVEEFLDFAQNCRLDSYSRNLSVTLASNIDLSGTDFAGIPVFGGTFDGAGYRITGLSLKGAGSVQGLFRYLESTAEVRNLTVEGEVIPSGSRSTVGGIAGSNAGRIRNCVFSGEVAGADTVGGLVGINTASGVIDGCSVEGSVHGNHFVGGVAGENRGVIRSSENAAQINATAQHNSVDISDITIGNLTGSESANTATDIGGIAGTSSGMIRDCENTGSVGYRQIGYNIGGIVGSQSGFVTQCRNFGKISGRKEVGGIVGQLEPVATVFYETDTLQILRAEMALLSDLVERASANAQSNTAEIRSLITNLQNHVQNAQDAIGQLIPDTEEPSVPDWETFLAAARTLSDSLTGISNNLRDLSAALEDTSDDFTQDMQAISDQMTVINGILENSSDNLGGSVTDVSDRDTEEDLSSKVSDCVNYGRVLADLNAGGITGAIAFENDLDPEENVQISGSQSLNFAGELRSVILGCKNQGVVTAKKQSAGGIVGWMSMGLVRDSLNTGAVKAENGDYAGGIAGRSDGFIRGSSAKCALSGGAYVGGIAGSGRIVSDCRSMVLVDGTEKLGAILGFAEEVSEEQPVAGNYYLEVGADIGAVDGISYAGCAEPLSREAFLALEALPEEFRTVTVYFIFEDGTQQTVAVAPNGALNEADIPAVPQKDGYTGGWEGLEETDLTDISFDTTFHVRYIPLESTIGSEQTRENGMPILLVQGQFTTDQKVSLKQATNIPALPEGQTLVEAWQFRLPGEEAAAKLRCALPQGYDGADVAVMVLRDGKWQETDFTVNGSYLVFSCEAGEDTFCLVQLPADYTVVLWAAGGSLAVLGAVLILWLVRKKVRSKAKAETKSE